MNSQSEQFIIKKIKSYNFNTIQILRLFILLLFALNIKFSYSQDTVKHKYLNKTIVGSKCHYGFVIYHRESMRHLVTGHFPALEITAGKTTNGEKLWQRLYKYPDVGLCFFYSGLANKEHLGNVIALYPYINFPLINCKIYRLNFRFGTGLGYITKPFNRTENYKDIAIGSHLNAAINLTFESNFKLFENFILTTGIGLTHFSNAAFKTPNLGINIPTISLGTYYKFSRSVYLSFGKDTLVNKKLQYSVYVTGGIKEIYPEDGPKYGTYSLGFCALKPLSLKNRFGLGFDLFYNPSTIKLLENDSIYISHNYEIIRPGINLTYEIVISKISICVQVGTYVFAKYKLQGDVYEKLGWKYFITNHIFSTITLKAHSTVADDFDLGIGYKF
ncbi:MAG: acyloxyacyl hydrolase [Bacteroidales bacterium]|nr:acyloxyacyl hydrolase [Bacteroidales bacterium]